DIDVSAADLYDLFGFPSDDRDGGEKVYVALTFASVPKAGEFDTDMLYRLRFNPHARAVPPSREDWSLDALLHYFDAVKDTCLGDCAPAEIRVTVGSDQRARVSFAHFPGGGFSTVVNLNEVTTIQTPDGYAIKAYLGGRDDAFFNDLPGFFRSINYAPQFYHVPHSMTEARELPIPKTLLELEGNDLFNFNPEHPMHGRGEKYPLPPGPWTWNGDRFAKDADGNFRFVYSGVDAQAGRNINTIALEMPHEYLTRTP